MRWKVIGQAQTLGKTEKGTEAKGMESHHQGQTVGEEDSRRVVLSENNLFFQSTRGGGREGEKQETPICAVPIFKCLFA